MNKPAHGQREMLPQPTKQRILAAAEEVFAARGFEGASTREIAAAAGVNISSLHYHWESKETLYLAVFRNIYERIVEVVRESIPGPGESGRGIDFAMGRLFDFFADHPTIPKLLTRNLLESDEERTDIEHNVLLPAWERFAAWTRSYTAEAVPGDLDVTMLSLNSVLLLFLLDSPQYRVILGGSITQPEIRNRVRRHVIDLVHTLLGRRD